MKCISIKRMVFLIAMVVFSMANADEPRDVFELSVQGSIVVDVDGRVLSHELESNNMMPQVKRLIDQNIKGWQFEPVRQNGKPVQAATRMQLAITAVPGADGRTTLTLDNVWFGIQELYGDITLPSYPRQALNKRLEAKVLVMAKIGADGSVTAVHPYQTSLSENPSSEALAQKMRDQFESSSLKAVAKWKFKPQPDSGEAGVAGSVIIPVAYALDVPGGRPAGHAMSRGQSIPPLGVRASLLTACHSINWPVVPPSCSTRRSSCTVM